MRAVARLGRLTGAAARRKQRPCLNRSAAKISRTLPCSTRSASWKRPCAPPPKSMRAPAPLAPRCCSAKPRWPKSWLPALAPSKSLPTFCWRTAAADLSRTIDTAAGRARPRAWTTLFSLRDWIAAFRISPRVHPAWSAAALLLIGRLRRPGRMGRYRPRSAPAVGPNGDDRAGSASARACGSGPRRRNAAACRSGAAACARSFARHSGVFGHRCRHERCSFGRIV